MVTSGTSNGSSQYAPQCLSRGGPVNAHLDSVVTAVIATLFPTDSADKPSDAAFEAWHAIRSSRMVIHAIICGAAAHRDSQRLTIEQSKSREVFAHRGEALRLISNELSNLREGDEPSEALIFSVLAMTAEPIDDSPQAMDIDNGTVQPFHLSHMQQGWERSFLRVRYSQVHHHGLFGLVARCGGLTALQNRALAQMISNHDVLMAAQELRPPRQPFAQVDEIASLVSDPSLNVPELEPHEGRAPGCSLPTLQRSLGTSSLLASVLTGLQRIVAVDEALARGTLRNTNVLALGGEKQALHHAILSVPPLPSTADRSLHEPVRLVTLIFDVGILFPLPPATGALARLVRWMKAALEDIEMKPVRNGWTEALIWIHFVGGVAAKGMAERVWFVERLSGLMDWQGMTSWAEVKQLLRSFVWMADAMNEEAISLWDEAHCHGGT